MLDKYVYISYGDNEKAIANRLRDVLETIFEKNVSVRNLELRAGTLLEDALDDAIAPVKWFILILGPNTLDDPNAKREIRIANIKFLEEVNFKIITINLTKSPLPRELRLHLESHYVLDLSDIKDLEDEFYRIAQYIEDNNVDSRQEQAFVDRGSEADVISYAARYHKFIFLLGFSGIGKSSFALTKIPRILRKQALSVSFGRTKGTSFDYVAGQIMKKSYESISYQDNDLSDENSVQIVAELIQKRQRRIFLFIDNFEYGLDARSCLSETVENFLLKLTELDVKTTVVMASTRFPRLNPGIAKHAEIIRFQPLEDRYIEQAIDIWMTGQHRKEAYLNQVEFPDLLKSIAGYPLAAKLVTASMKAGISPRQILNAGEFQDIELRLASHALDTLSTEQLDEMDSRILQAIALIEEPVTIDDLLAIGDFSELGSDKLYTSVNNLQSLFLIEENEEGQFFIHPFLTRYYQNQLKETAHEAWKTCIVNDFGAYSYEQTIKLNKKLEQLIADRNVSDLVDAERLSGEIFRLSVSASKFLRINGQEALVKNLPYDIKGTVREMVLYFYQQERDFVKSLQYAERWLQLAPNDYEIKLYKARSLRNLGGQRNLKEAHSILSEIEANVDTRFFNDRVANEKSKIAVLDNNDEIAMMHLQQAVEQGAEFAEVYLSLARLYLKLARNFPEKSSGRFNYALEAAELLEGTSQKVWEGINSFQSAFTDLYVSALMELNDKKALPILDEALNNKPNDPFLNFRKAEILRESGEPDESIVFAEIAVNNNSIAALQTLASIYYEKGVRTIRENQDLGQEYLNKALHFSKKYKSKSANSKWPETIIFISKILKALGNYEQAKEELKPFLRSYYRDVVLEYIEINFALLEENISNNESTKAKDNCKEIQETILNFEQEIHEPLRSNLLLKLKELKCEIEDNK